MDNQRDLTVQIPRTTIVPEAVGGCFANWPIISRWMSAFWQLIFDPMTPEKPMNVEFKLPALGENIAGGDVVSVLVREGDVIAANDGVIELETDKAVVEIPCPHAGKITKVLVTKGQTVKVGQPVLTCGSGARRNRQRRNRRRRLRSRKRLRRKQAGASRSGGNTRRAGSATLGPRTGR